MHIKRIAKITGTMLGVEDHGIFTAMVYVEYGGGAQGIGGFALACPTHKTEEFVFNGNDYAAKFILGVLSAAGVPTWERLNGRTLFVLFDKRTDRPLASKWRICVADTARGVCRSKAICPPGPLKA